MRTRCGVWGLGRRGRASRAHVQFLSSVDDDATDGTSTHAARTSSAHARVSAGNENALDGGGHADDALASGDAAAPFRRLFGGAGGFFVVFAGVVFGDFDGGGEWDFTRVRVVVVVVVVGTRGDGIDERAFAVAFFVVRV